MKKLFCPTRIVMLLATIACTICVVSFRQKNPAQPDSFRTQTNKDTTTPNKRSGDADVLRMDQLNESMKQLEVQMSKLEEQMKQLDFQKMQKEINASLSAIDAEKISKDVEKAMKSIDWKKMDAELKESMAKVKEVDMEKLKASLDNVRTKLDREHFKVDIDHRKIQESVSKAMEKAKVSMEKAKVEMENSQACINELAKDGLIDKNKAYNVEVKNNELYINGTLQSKEISEKYRKFYKRGNFSIRNDGGSKGKDWI
ncbi:hypothetical protein EXU57_05195 [Segetibacter sp. 3557_3]|uniref:hypothetical protein n=1 Tax=Segetibacter sp. 3557_3 TaxID=2547429 RepID=UPI001058C78F|nr:hypothetical protein [Segetibacter sp. 3557_3]TDH27863.1 hypothetical protein EXU57_05195 [Segetibacter sp. 3557_3]